MPYSTEAVLADTAQVQHETLDLFGSGRLIARNLILTARHVVLPTGSEIPEKRGWRIRLISDRTDGAEGGRWAWTNAELVWFGSASVDLALLKVIPNQAASAKLPHLDLRIGSITQFGKRKVVAVGFPRGAKANDKRLILVASGNLSDEGNATLSFGVEPTDQPESPTLDWPGFSGAAVLLDESPDRPELGWIYGVAQQVPKSFSGRLEVARLADAWNDEDFRKELDSSGCSVQPPDDPIAAAQFPQPELSKADPSSTNLFYYASRIIPFFGREKEMDALDRFLACPAKFAWYLITGDGGVGKSRLALELCLRIGSNWHSGFIGKEWLKRGLWQNWQPNRQTLIVVDDAGAYGEELGALARALRTKAELTSKVRVLLIERERKSWFDAFLGRSTRDREEILVSQYPARGGEPLAVTSLSESDTLRIMRSIASSQGPSANPTDATLIGNLRRLDSQARPLFAALLAATRVSRIEPLGVIREILDYEQTRWKAAGATDEDKRLVAIATICGGIKNPAFGDIPPPSDKIYQGFSASRYQSIVGKSASVSLSALQPDILGELFVLDWLSSLEQDEATQVVETAWSLGYEGVRRFIFRAVQDFSEHPELSRILAPPEADTTARHSWSSGVVDLLLGIPARYLTLGTQLYSLLKSVAFRHRDDSTLYEDLVRAATNLLAAFQAGGRLDLEKLQYAEAEELIDHHPIAKLRSEGEGRLRAYNIRKSHMELASISSLPLPPYPLTFVRPIQLLNLAVENYEELAKLSELHPESSELLRLRPAGAFESILGLVEIARASTRLNRVVSTLLAPDIEAQIERGEEIYKGLESWLANHARADETDLILAKSASAIIAAHSSVSRIGIRSIEETNTVYVELLKLVTLHSEEPKFQEEMARALYNLAIFVGIDSSQSSSYYAELSRMANDYDDESIVGKLKSRAADALGL